jgi:hypothetical protein
VAPTQVPKGAKGPTAMVFMNMGGPATTDEVHGFLSMLFVRSFRTRIIHGMLTRAGRQRPDSSRTFPELHWTVHRAETNTEDSKTVRGDWWRIAHQEMVRVPGR